MKTTKVIYWISAALVALAMVYSTYSDLYSLEVQRAFVHLGFPGYFRIELGAIKVIGIVLLLTPVPGVVKEWAYPGVAITFVSAFIAHSAAGDPVGNRIAPVVLLFLAVSWFSRYRIRRKSNVELSRIK